jgi:predicted RNase H-like nuclease
MRFVGVDGCANGWVAVSLTDEQCEVSFFQTIGLLWDTFGQETTLMLIDMPIGLPTGGDQRERMCDVMAKRYLGKRGSSIFPAPCRELLQPIPYKDANDRTRKLIGKGLSKQTFNLLPKIHELDTFLQHNPSIWNKIHESHPELLYQVLAGSRSLHSKKDATGVMQRLDLLSSFIDVTGQLLPAIRKSSSQMKGVKPDDLLDACVMAVIARLSSQQGLESVSEIRQFDAIGLPMEIVLTKSMMDSIKTRTMSSKNQNL